MNAPLVVTRAEAAQMLGVSVRTLARWDEREDVPLSPIVLGGTVRYRLSDLQMLINPVQESV